MKRVQVLLLPGVVLPASVAYPALIEALGDDVEAVAKELELYATDRPPPGYGLDHEVAGILRAASSAGFDRFHLVGYSAGGASALAFAAQHPDRLRSLALLEAAWAGDHAMTPEERAARRALTEAVALPVADRMAAFARSQLAQGVTPPPPPPGPPPPWMARRPAGLVAISEAFERAELDVDVLRRLDVPVYYALGGLSNPGYYARQAERLARILPRFTLDVYEDRHHFDPPHRAEPQRLAVALRSHWAGA